VELIPLPVNHSHCICYSIRYVDNVDMAVKMDNVIVRFMICVHYVGVSLPV